MAETGSSGVLIRDCIRAVWRHAHSKGFGLESWLRYSRRFRV